MRIDISDAVSQLTKEKNIDRELMSSIIEEIMVMMIRKKYGSEENFDVFVNIDKGEIEI